MKDSDFKRKVEQAATIQLAASFLKIPQAMRVAGFKDEDYKSAAKQMQVRRAQDAMQKSTRMNKMLASACRTSFAGVLSLSWLLDYIAYSGEYTGAFSFSSKNLNNSRVCRVFTSEEFCRM